MPIPLPVITDVFRCALKWDWSGGQQKAVNVIHIHAGATGQAASDAFAALDASVVVGMWDNAVNVAGITEVDITKLDGASATTSFSTGGAAKWSGSAGGNMEPAAAVLVKGSTGVRGRDNRGRVFLPFTSEAAVDNGFLVSGLAATMTTAWETFITNLQALSPVSWGFGVAAYDRAHSGAGAHFTGYDQILVEGALGTQRRRQTRNR
jgi:hypothetical protein